MTGYMIGYIVFVLLFFLAINYFMARKPKVKEINKVEEEKYELHRGRIIFVVIFGMFMTILNQTTLNVALPKMMADLNVNTTTAQWLITGYMLVNGVLIPISAFLVNRFGFRKLILTAVVSFTIGSFICAISHGFSIVMIGRIIQAIGAGILMPLGMVIFMTLFPPEKRGVAFGMLGIAMILAPAVGPTLSGWLVEHYTWNVMFYIMTIIGFLDIGFSYFWFKMPEKTIKDSFDLLGIIFSCIGFGFLLYGFSEAGTNGWRSSTVLISLFVGVLFIILFSARQFRTNKPLLDLHVLKYNTFTFSIIINAIVTMSMFGAMLLLPVYLQNIRGFSPVQSGLLLLPGALLMGLMSPISGIIFDKFGIKVLAITGLAITAYATWEFTKLNSSTSYNFILGLYTLRSFGMSMLMMPIMTNGINALPQKLIADGNALSNTARQIAGSIGTAIFVTIMTQQTTNHYADFSNMLTVQNQSTTNQVQQLSNGISAMTHLPSQTSGGLTQELLYGQAMTLSTIHGINDAFVFATIITIIALILAFFLKTPKVRKEESKTTEIKETVNPNE